MRRDILIQFRGEKFRLGELTIGEVDVIEKTFGIGWADIRAQVGRSPRAAQAVLGIAALRQGLTTAAVVESVADLTLEQLEDAFSVTDDGSEPDEPDEPEPSATKPEKPDPLARTRRAGSAGPP